MSNTFISPQPGLLHHTIQFLSQIRCSLMLMIKLRTLYHKRPSRVPTDQIRPIARSDLPPPGDCPASTEGAEQSHLPISSTPNPRCFAAVHKTGKDSCRELIPPQALEKSPLSAIFRSGGAGE